MKSLNQIALGFLFGTLLSLFLDSSEPAIKGTAMWFLVGSFVYAFVSEGNHVHMNPRPKGYYPNRNSGW